MVGVVFIVVITVVIVFEVVEHVIIPLIGVCADRGRQPLSGPEGMVGKAVDVRLWSGRAGTVFVNGEFWQAKSRTPLATGDEATIVAVRNLTLRVEPLARSIASEESPGTLPSR